MATLATLKSRIALDIRRNNLTADIAYAIGDAVAEYQGSRFAFNQVRDTFVTVAGTEFYEAGTDPEDIPTDIAEIDSLTLSVNGRTHRLAPRPFGWIEWVNTTTTSRGEPECYCWYAEKIRLYPVPDAAYTLTLSYLKRIAAPSADGDSNAWTTEAEQLIRAAAKRILYRDVVKDMAAADASAQAEAIALRRLKRESHQLDTGCLAPSGI